MSHENLLHAFASDPTFLLSLVLHITIVTAVTLILDIRFKKLPTLRHATLASALLLVLLSPLSVALLRHGNVGRLHLQWDATSAASDSFSARSVLPGQGVEVLDHRQGAEHQDATGEKVVGQRIASEPSAIVGDTRSDSLSAQLGSKSSTNTFAVAPAKMDPPDVGLADSRSSSGSTKLIPVLLGILMAIWCVGTLVLLLRTVRGMSRLKAILRDARPVSSKTLQREFWLACRSMRLQSQSVSLVESNCVEMPVAVGVIHRKVVVPRGLVSCRDEGRLREIFIHELAHLVRRDQIFVWIQHLVAALYWWHPLVRRLNQHLAQAREEVCDNYVLGVSDATHYSRTLLALTEQGCGAGVPDTVVGLFSSRWKLEQRVSALLDSNRSKSTHLSSRGICVVVFFAIIAVWLAGQSAVTLGSEEPQVSATQAAGEVNAGEPDSDRSAESSPAFSGTVRDSQGQPAEHATVVLIYRERDERTLKRKVSKTDASGEYRFEQVPVASPDLGFHALLVYLPGHAFSRRSNYRNPPQPSEDSTTITTDFSLVESVESPLTVVDEKGAPVSGAKLELLNTNGDISSNLMIQEQELELCGITNPQSDETGQLTIPGIDRTRSYDLRISHPDFAETPLWNVTLDGNPQKVVIEKGQEVRFDVSCESDPSAVAQAKIEIMVSEVGGHSLLLRDVDSSGTVRTRLRDQHTTIHIEHPRLAGLPWYFYSVGSSVMPFRLYPTGKVTGRVVDPQTGEGVEGVSVRFVRENRVIKQVRTDAEGNYQCELAATSYETSIETRSGRWQSSESTVSVDVVASQTVVLDDLTASAKSKIRGRVVTESGKPVPNALVVQNFRRDAILTDLAGRFELAPERSTAYPIRVLHPYEKVSRVVASPKAGEELTIRLAAEGVLTGVLRDASGRTLPNLEAGLGVMFHRPGGRFRGGVSTILETLQTDDQGFVRFVGLSEGLAYRLNVGRLAFGSSGGNEKRSENFYVPNLPAVPVEIEVDAPLQSELKKQAAMKAASQTVLPFGEVKWLGQPRVDVENFGGEWLMISSASHPMQFAQSELALQLYGDRGLVVVGVLGAQMSNLQDAEEIRFPAAIDNDQAQIMGRYGHSNSGDVLIYNYQGKLVRTIRRGTNLLPIVRNLILYGE